MPRSLIAEGKQAVSTFNPVLSGYEGFTRRHGQAILDYHRRVRSEGGGHTKHLILFPRLGDWAVMRVGGKRE